MEQPRSPGAAELLRQRALGFRAFTSIQKVFPSTTDAEKAASRLLSCAAKVAKWDFCGSFGPGWKDKRVGRSCAAAIKAQTGARLRQSATSAKQNINSQAESAKTAAVQARLITSGLSASKHTRGNKTRPRECARRSGATQIAQLCPGKERDQAGLSAKTSFTHRFVRARTAAF